MKKLTASCLFACPAACRMRPCAGRRCQRRAGKRARYTFSFVGRCHLYTARFQWPYIFASAGKFKRR